MTIHEKLRKLKPVLGRQKKSGGFGQAVFLKLRHLFRNNLPGPYRPTAGTGEIPEGKSATLYIARPNQPFHILCQGEPKPPK
jgi:hypothetical protein